MNTTGKITRQLKRLALSLSLATAMFAGGFSLESAHADERPAWGEGVIITPASATPDDRVAVKDIGQFKRGKIVALDVQRPAGTIIVKVGVKVIVL